jgi:hypothetical protein
MRILRGRVVLTGLAVVAMSVAAAGCGSDLPTSPQELIEELAELVPTAELTLSNATISVGGQPVNGQTIQHGFMQGANTFFQARLHEGDHPALGQTVQVKYRWPGGMGMMMNRQGVATLYDDGTHGDWQAGDGIYCLEDFQHQAGFCGQGAPNGTYHYEFWGEGTGGHHSNHLDVAVTVTNQ